MKPISLSVSEDDYEAFRRAARAQRRPIAQLLREAMTIYRRERLRERSRLTELPVFPGPQPVGPLPSRVDLYHEMLTDRGL